MLCIGLHAVYSGNIYDGLVKAVPSSDSLLMQYNIAWRNNY